MAESLKKKSFKAFFYKGKFEKLENPIEIDGKFTSRLSLESALFKSYLFAFNLFAFLPQGIFQ